MQHILEADLGYIKMVDELHNFQMNLQNLKMLDNLKEYGGGEKTSKSKSSLREGFNNKKMFSWNIPHKFYPHPHLSSKANRGK